jgi:DNA invertase Pin-like site-specific DNA recombinase
MPAPTHPLVPKSAAGELNVVAIGRISTVHQDAENIEASYRYIQEYLGRIYQGPLKITALGELASGMLTDRATIREAEQLVAGGNVDLVIAEDLARIYRNPRFQYDFVQNCVDMSTRVICIGDNLDTADENWEITMGAAALRHGLHVPDCRRRVRRTATHSFHRGGMVLKIRFGYRKLTREEAASGQFGPADLRIAKREECTPIIREMMQRVIRGASYAAIADWLNAEGIEPGPYVRSRQWAARLVVALLDHPLISGTRTFREMICRPVFRTGRHKSSKNAEPETEHCPALAHLAPEEHQVLRREIARRRAESRANTKRKPTRQGVPRSRSIWPGQSATCAICGGMIYYAGTHLRCSNAMQRSGPGCWNHVQMPAQLTRERVVSWLVEYLDGRPVLRQALVESVWALVEQGSGGPRRRQRDLAREIALMERQSANLATAIAEGGQLSTLIGKLQAVENSLQTARESQRVEREQSAESNGLLSKKQVEENLHSTLIRLVGSSFPMADLLRRVFPAFILEPAQALDTPLVRPRARLTFRPSSLVNIGAGESTELADVQVKIDLFNPPLHIGHMPACLAAKAEAPKLSLKKLATKLGINYTTVKRALDYSQRMAAAGMSEPYRLLEVRPEAASRWHPRRRAS